MNGSFSLIKYMKKSSDFKMKNIDGDEVKLSFWGVRHTQTLLLFLGMMLAFAMRVNMSMAIVSMTDKNDVENAFDWSMQTQSVILSSFFWGYVVLQIFGGELAKRFGGKILITSSLGINAVLSLLIPISAYFGGWKLVCACRVFQGLSQGFLYPCTHHLIGQWVPLEEKSRLSTIIYVGGQFGTALQLLAAGFTAEYLGWPAIFYINGTLSAIWTVFYIFLGADSPKSSRTISVEERHYIQNSLGHMEEKKTHKTPWYAIATSLPFYSLLLAQLGQVWGIGVLLTEVPTYMSNVLGVDIKSNGVMTAIPYFTMTLISFPFGYISDYALNKKWLSITVSRKISNTINQYGAAALLLILTTLPENNVVLSVILFILIMGVMAGQYTGYLLVPIDMAPNFAGTLMGISNSVSNFIAIFSMLVTGVLVKDETDAKEWRNVFYLCSAVYFVCNTFFLLFGSCKKQPWNEVDDKSEDTDTSIEKPIA